MQAPYRRVEIDSVSDADQATQLTELTAVGNAFDTEDDARLAAFYSYPEGLERCWVRANMISSLDGGATDDGKAGGLAGQGDRALFARMRQEDDARHRFGALAEVIDASGRHTDRVDPVAVLDILERRGMRRVLTEGGPSLLSLFIVGDLLDELCVTIAPILVGGQARRIASGSGESHTRMRRSHVLSDDEGYLYTRYVKAD